MREKEIVTLEIGCNKGFDSVGLLRLFTGDKVYSKSLWRRQTGFANTCGACGQCLDDLPVLAEVSKVSYTHYCVEPLRVNFARLRRGIRGLRKFKDLKLINAAMMHSPSPRFVYFPRHAPAGKENIGVSTNRERGMMRVPATSVDEFTRERGIRINILLIDTEGNDARVLYGARDVLTNQKPSYVVFEVHKKGEWKKIQLSDVLEFLRELGYVCFWAGKGKLYRITDCWNDSYNVKTWSNIACHHRDAKVLGLVMDGAAQPPSSRVSK